MLRRHRRGGIIRCSAKNQKLMHRTPSRCRACLVPKLLACPERYKQLLRGLRVRGIIHSFCFLDALTYLYLLFLNLMHLIHLKTMNRKIYAKPLLQERVFIADGRC
ncbi:hypothetical protein RIR_jg24817.t1 [Rhizophagus irregularis DAOM 181602=DAOM 197198]|nr:hypothetical protein RIR_jg24817.t1 [Rhizophagus irregularis DAOM 181602=DAOM 197198]